MCCNSVDILTEAKNYKGNSLLDQSLAGYHAHAGILRSALQIKQDLFALNILSSFFDKPEHGNYTIRIVGHSLGAGASSLLTVLLLHDSALKEYLGSTFQQRILSCLYGQPLVMHPELAAKPVVMAAITSVAYKDDIICHLSPTTIITLHKQILSFYLSREKDAKKWKIYSDFVRKKESPDMLAKTDGVDVRDTEKQIFEELESKYTDPENCAPAGRIFQMLPVCNKQAGTHRRKVSCLVSCLVCCPANISSICTVYPASSLTFTKEIRVSRSMFLDHMPFHYDLAQLDGVIPS